MKKKKSSVKSLDDVILIVIGPHVWGKGHTLDEAMLHASKPKQYVVYLAHKNSTIDPVSGGIYHPLAYPPREILRKGIPKEKKESGGKKKTLSK